MNFAVKKMLKKLNVVNGFRKIMAYVLIFSLLWQNSLWAHYGLYTIEEDLQESRVRTYSGRKAAIVEPGTIRDTEIHNVFQDLQLFQTGGLVFTGAPNTTKIYNRIYSANPIHLSGVIEADYPLPMVFANPGGILLENPDFQNIHDLTLAAGSLAQTNEGMAYGVDEGFLTINKTFIQEQNDVKNLSLAGRGIRIAQSFLSPSETLILRAGQHVKGWNAKGEWVNEDHLEPNDFPLLDQHSIVLDDTTILRSKGLFFESLEEYTSIHAGGLLQSTEGDIIIRAKGDVYLNNLFAYRNLKIKTTGKVFLGNQAFVGGSVKIKASEIINQGKLIGVGKITFDAPWSQNNGFIKTQGVFDAKVFLNTAGSRVEARSIVDPLSLLSRNLGYVEIQDDLKLNCKKETLKGTIKTHGKVEVSGQELTLDGNVSAQNGFVFKGLKKLTNGIKSTLSVFGTGVQGTLDTLINEGKLDFSSINATIKDSKNKSTGFIHTRGHSILQGNDHTNEGKIFTGGVHQTTLIETDPTRGTYKDSGTFYSPMLFQIKARNVEYSGKHKSFFKDGSISVTVGGILINKGAAFKLYGNKDSCIFQLNSKGNLKFEGNLRLLCSNQFPISEYFKDFNQPPLLYAEFDKRISSLISAKQLAELKKPLGTGICLQAIGATGDVNCQNADINPESGSVSLFAKNGKVIANESKIKAGYFKKNNTEIQSKIVCLNNTNLSSSHGYTSILAQETATLNGSGVEGRLSASVLSKNIGMENSSVKSSHGSFAVHGEDDGYVDINNSSFNGQSGGSFKGGDLGFRLNRVEVSRGIIEFQASKFATINQSSLKSQGTAVDGGKRLTFSHNDVEGLYNSFRAEHIKADSNTINGPAIFSGGQTLEIHNLNASRAVTAFAPTSTFSGTNTAESWCAQSTYMRQLGAITTVQDTHLEATESYIDNAQSRNEAGGNLFIYADETEGFEGYQKAGDTLELKLKDMNLFDLLSQTEARITKAHLREAEVNFREDFILDRTLHLWGKSLENKAKFTATKDFIAHMQTLIMNEGSMVAKGNMTLESQGTVGNFGLMEAENLNVKGKTVLDETVVKRHTIQGGYEDRIESRATMRARKNLNVEATELLQARGAKFEAKLNVSLKSAGALYLGPQELSSGYKKSSKKRKVQRFVLINHKTQVNSGKNVDIESGEGMIFEGLDVRAAGYIHAKSTGEIESKTVHDIFQEQKKSESKGGTFRKKKKKATEKTSDKAASNNFEAEEDVRFDSEGNNTHQATHVKSGGSTTINSNQGKVIIKADKSSEMRSTQKSSKSAVWQSQQQKGRYDETVEMLEILAKGGIHISGAQGVEVEIKGVKGKNQAKAIDFLENHIETAWVQKLRKDPKVTWHLIVEEHKKWNKKTQGLTGPAAAVISIAIAIATQGVGAGLISGLTTNATAGAMASAGFTSLVSKASLSLINNQGNIGKTLKEMGSKESLRNLATAVATAGATNGLSSTFNVPTNPHGVVEHLHANAVGAGVKMVAGVAIKGQKFENAFKETMKGLAIDTISASLANEIKAQYGKEGNLNFLTHKAAHGALGGAAGYALGGKSGALSGALGAIMAETVAELTIDREKARREVMLEALQGGHPLTEESLQAAYKEKLRPQTDLVRLGTSIAALLANQDVGVANYTGTNALENNFLAEAKPFVISKESVDSLYESLKEAGEGILEFLETNAEFLQKAKDQMLNENAAEIKETREKLAYNILSFSEKEKLQDREKELLIIEKQISGVDVRWGTYCSNCIQAHQEITAQGQPLLKGTPVSKVQPINNTAKGAAIQPPQPANQNRADVTPKQPANSNRKVDVTPKQPANQNRESKTDK